MKITYKYKRYENSRAATEWSLIAGMLPAIGIFIIIGLAVLGGNLFGNAGGIIGFILGIALVVGGTAFAHYMESRCFVKAVLKENLGRNPTREEVSGVMKQAAQDRRNKRSS